jgi:ribosomal protein S18 acetylase RimI-like enzyme
MAKTRTDDQTTWARIRAFDLGLRARVAQRAPTAFGVAFRFPEPAFWDLNFLYVERPATPAAGLARDADAALAGLRHRMIVIDEPPDATRLAADLGREGWAIERHVAMAADGPGDRAGSARAVREVPPPAVVPVRRRAMRDEGFDEETVAAIEAADVAIAHAAAERDVVSLAGDGAIAAFAKLYTDGRTGQIEDVATLREHRRVGHGAAVVLGALDASRRAGHDLTFLWADEDAFPSGMYARLGFRVVGRRWRMRRLAEP